MRGASSGASATASGRSSRSSTGTRSVSRPTSTSTRSRTTRCTTRATSRSAASRAPGPWRPARTSARAAGPAPTSSSAASMPFRRCATKRLTERRSVGSGFTLWFTGLSGAGKTTIAELVGRELERRGRTVEYLDGDVVRTHLSKGLGFSKEDRDTNIERIGWVASRLTRHGAAVLVSAISPYEETRETARDMVEEYGAFVCVFVKA